MLKFIIVNLFKIIYPFVSRKFNFSPKVDNLVNTVFKTNFNNRKIDIKTDKAILLKLLYQAASKEEADKIRNVLKEQDKKKQLPANLLALVGVIAIIVIPFNMNSSTGIRDGLYLIGAIIIGLYLFYMSKGSNTNVNIVSSQASYLNMRNLICSIQLHTKQAQLNRVI